MDAEIEADWADTVALSQPNLMNACGSEKTPFGAELREAA